jgi:hypothetical protein
MQDPGSDAGVFVWADGADGLSCAVKADARATPRRKIRNVTLKKTRHARPDIPVMHMARQIYDGVC